MISPTQTTIIKADSSRNAQTSEAKWFRPVNKFLRYFTAPGRIFREYPEELMGGLRTKFRYGDEVPGFPERIPRDREGKDRERCLSETKKLVKWSLSLTDKEAQKKWLETAMAQFAILNDVPKAMVIARELEAAKESCSIKGNGNSVIDITAIPDKIEPELRLINAARDTQHTSDDRKTAFLNLIAHFQKEGNDVFRMQAEQYYHAYMACEIASNNRLSVHYHSQDYDAYDVANSISSTPEEIARASIIVACIRSNTETVDSVINDAINVLGTKGTLSALNEAVGIAIDEIIADTHWHNKQVIYGIIAIAGCQIRLGDKNAAIKTLERVAKLSEKHFSNISCYRLTAIVEIVGMLVEKLECPSLARVFARKLNKIADGYPDYMEDYAKKPLEKINSLAFGKQEA